jgi:hypothetical protein
LGGVDDGPVLGDPLADFAGRAPACDQPLGRAGAGRHASLQRLAPLGLEVARRVEALADWIEGNLPSIMEARRLRS